MFNTLKDAGNPNRNLNCSFEVTNSFMEHAFSMSRNGDMMVYEGINAPLRRRVSCPNISRASLTLLSVIH